MQGLVCVSHTRGDNRWCSGAPEVHLLIALRPEDEARLAAERAETRRLLGERRLDPDHPAVQGYQRPTGRRLPRPSTQGTPNR